MTQLVSSNSFQSRGVAAGNSPGAAASAGGRAAHGPADAYIVVGQLVGLNESFFSSGGAPIPSTEQRTLPETLLSELRSGSVFTRSHAALRLSGLPQANADALFSTSLKLLEDPSPQVRLKALDLLGADPYRAYPYLDSKQAELSDRLLEAVNRDPEASVQSRAVRALAAQGADGLRALLELADDRRETVRFDVAWALLRFREHPVALHALRVLEHDGCSDVSKVAKALLLGY